MCSCTFKRIDVLILSLMNFVSKNVKHAMKITYPIWQNTHGLWHVLHVLQDLGSDAVQLRHRFPCIDIRR